MILFFFVKDLTESNFASFPKFVKDLTECNFASFGCWGKINPHHRHGGGMFIKNPKQ
jgi:hypothetical protein